MPWKIKRRKVEEEKKKIRKKYSKRKSTIHTIQVHMDGWRKQKANMNSVNTLKYLQFFIIIIFNPHEVHTYCVLYKQAQNI